MVHIKKVPLKGYGVFASKDITKSTEVIVGKPLEKIAERTWYSLEIDEDVHVRLDRPFETVNHSCRPNCGIVKNGYGGYTLIALEDIAKDDEITFDYAMTEWKLVADFTCACGAQECRKTKIGAENVDYDLLKRYLPYLADHIKNRILKEHPALQH